MALSMRGEYSIQWYASRYLDLANEFRFWCHSQSGILSATRRGFAIQGMSTLRRHDFLSSSPVRGDTQYLQRESLDLDMSYWLVFDQAHDHVEHVDIDTLDYDEGQPPVITQRVEVDGSE